MKAIIQRMTRIYWPLTAALFAVGLGLALLYAPVDATWGPVQKVLYLHLPMAVNMFIAAFVVFVAGIGYIWQRNDRWDDLGASAARATVATGSVVLLSGMIWAHSAWDTWWTWSPRLTFSLVLWALYVAYLICRTAIASPERRALVGAIFGIIAFLDVPLLYLSVMLMPDVHPTSIELTPPMKVTLGFAYIPVTLACLGLMWDGCGIGLRFREARARLPKPALPKLPTIGRGKAA